MAATTRLLRSPVGAVPASRFCTSRRCVVYGWSRWRRDFFRLTTLTGPSWAAQNRNWPPHMGQISHTRSIALRMCAGCPSPVGWLSRVPAGWKAGLAQPVALSFQMRLKILRHYSGGSTETNKTVATTRCSTSQTGAVKPVVSRVIPCRVCTLHAFVVCSAAVDV